MAFLRGLLALPLVIGIVAFATTHTTEVPVILNPVQPPIELPLYVVALGFLAVGVLLGCVVAWLGMGKVRKEKRLARKEVKKLEKEVKKLGADLDKANVKLSDKGALKADIAELTPIEDIRKIS